MLSRLTVSRFGRLIPTSRTKPCIVYCENEDGEEIEFVIKLMAGGDTGLPGLVSEIIASQFAIDLDLKIPEPSLLEITDEFAATVPNPEIADIMKRSIGWNFATKKLPPSYNVVLSAKPISVELRKTAAEIFAFDAMIQNPDRIVTNPNCFTNGTDLVILDHEVAFSFIWDILPPKPPWKGGSLDFIKKHVFYEPLRKTAVNLDRLAGALEALTPKTIHAYRENVPMEWAGGKDAATKILDYILAMKGNLHQTLGAIRRILQ